MSWILNVCVDSFLPTYPPLGPADYKSLLTQACHWFSLSARMEPIHNSGQIIAVWDGLLFIFGGESRCLGKTNDTLFYHTLDTHSLFHSADLSHHPPITISFALDTSHLLLQGEYPADSTMYVLIPLISLLISPPTSSLLCPGSMISWRGNSVIGVTSYCAKPTTLKYVLFWGKHFARIEAPA